MTRFHILFGVDLLILLFVLWEGVELASSSMTVQTTGSAPVAMTRAPGETWLLLSPFVTAAVLMVAVLGAAAVLQARGRTGLAALLLLVPAVPVVLGGLFMIGLMVLFTMGTPSH